MHHDNGVRFVLASKPVAAVRAGLRGARLVGISQCDLGARHGLAIAAAHDARDHPGPAQLEIVGDLLGVVAETEQLGGQIALGFNPNRAVRALVQKQVVEIEPAVAMMSLAQSRAPVDPASRNDWTNAGNQVEAFNRLAGDGIRHPSMQM